MKRFTILTVALTAALMVAGGVIASNITSDGDGTDGTDSPPNHGPGIVYGPVQQPNAWYIVSTSGSFDMSLQGGPTAATAGTSGTCTAGVDPQVAKTAGLSTIIGMVTLFYDPFEDRPGNDIEWWIPGRQDKQPPCLWIHDTASGNWIGETPLGPTGQIGSGFNEDYFYYDIQLLENFLGFSFGPIDALCIGGGFGTNNHPAPGGSGTSDFDGDGTIDAEIWLGAVPGSTTGRVCAANTDGFNVGIIPEPMTMLLVGGGLLALIRRR